MYDSFIKQTVEKAIKETLNTTYNMDLQKARDLSEKIRQKAAKMGVNPVIAITNRGGNPVLVECSDHSFIASYDIALNKAYTVVALKMSTKKLSELARPGGSLYGIQFTNQNKIVIFGGGEPLINEKGDVIGGLGVSGGTEAQDTELARYGKEIFEKGK